MEKGDKRLRATANPQFPLVFMSTQLDSPSFDDSILQETLPQAYRSAIRMFKKATSSFVVFNAIFASLFAIEAILFLFFLPLYSQATFIASSLSGIFLTVFAYFVLFFYFQAKKPDQLSQIKEEFLQTCRKSAPGEAQPDLSIAAALLKLVSYLDGFEFQFYRIPQSLQFLQGPLSSFFALAHGQDVFRFKQVLLHAAVDEHLNRVRFSPTDLEIHASLAQVYIALCKLFAEPKDGFVSYFYQRKKELLSENFRTAAQLAVEEFQILNGFAPDDPWVHEQLAQGYRDLDMPKEELLEIETLLKLRPQDKELLARVGALYFDHGLNAKGLRVYEELKETSPKKAEELISSYGQLKGSGRTFEII